MSAPEALLAARGLPASPVPAQEMVALDDPYVTAGQVDDGYDAAVFGLELALQSRSLEITATAPVGATMAEKMPALGLGAPPFSRAEVFSFCSLELSARIVPDYPLAVAFCPMRFFVIEQDDVTTLGFANLPDMPVLAPAQAILLEIGAEAANGGF